VSPATQGIWNAEHAETAEKVDLPSKSLRALRPQRSTSSVPFLADDPVHQPPFLSIANSSPGGTGVATPKAGVFLPKALGLSIAVVLPFLLAGAFLTSPRVTASAPDAHVAPPDHVPAPSDSLDAEDDEDEAGLVDLFGNPVADAVAKYKFDATGSLYELHSPQTELPRLGSPKS